MIEDTELMFWQPRKKRSRLRSIVICGLVGLVIGWMINR